MNGFDGKTELGGQLDVFDPSSGTLTSNLFPADGMNGPGARSVAVLVTVNIGGDTLLVTIFDESDPSLLAVSCSGMPSSSPSLLVTRGPQQHVPKYA